MEINNFLMVWKTKRSKVLTFLYTFLDWIPCFSSNKQIETLREAGALCVNIWIVSIHSKTRNVSRKVYQTSERNFMTQFK